MNKLVAVLALAGGFCALAERSETIHWTVAVDPPAAAPGSTVRLKLTARLEPGWHVYSFSTPAATPVSIQLPADTPIANLRAYQPEPHRSFDQNFQSQTETYEGEVTFLVDAQLRPNLSAGPVPIELNLRFQTCSDKQCIPGRATVSTPFSIDPSAARAAATPVPDGYTAVLPSSAESHISPQGQGKVNSKDLASFLLIAFGFGLASLFTPCVFPMIPITMSYFLNRQSGTRRDSILQAALFCVGIIVLFSGLGLATTAILGPFGVVQLGSNPWVNAFISILFIAFGFSLLGAFEITIPSSILTRLDRGTQKGGFIGTLLMGLTFSLASFACVGPFVGTLLAASVQGGGARPLIGMVAFATGLALPFFLLALFPAYLKRLPRSGGWMSRTKVVMGFVILAASLKYLASLDQVLQWGFLTRERFLAAWIVLFALAGLYLLGMLRLEGIKPDDHMGPVRLLTAAAFLAFAISLLPGMFGSKLGELDAFVPLAAEASSKPGTPAAAGPVWMKNQYREALDRARREGKRVFIAFTGYACTNCHWMKANLLNRPEIEAAMKDFVLVELYTDGTDEASKLNQDLQLKKFETVAIPFYAIVDADEQVLAKFAGLTKDPQEYLTFLAMGSQAPAAAVAPQVSTTPATPQGLTRLDGSAMPSFAGKTTVVNFWATWCVPCIQEIPSFNRLHKELSGKGVNVVGVSMDEEGPDRVKAFLVKHPMDYPVAMGSEKISQQFKLEQLPVTLVFDARGKQVERFEGFTSERDLLAAIERAK